MSDTPAHRVYADPYTIVPNAAINDERLSWKARGLLVYMLSRPPEWQFSARRIAGVGPDGHTSVEAGLRELAALGYYRVTRYRLPGTDPVTGKRGGSFGMRTEVAARPELMPPEPGNRGPVDRSPVDGSPVKRAPKEVRRASTESKTGRGAVGSAEVKSRRAGA